MIGGTCIELGEGELPYAPLVAALRPLHRTCEPILDQLAEGTRSELARLNPELGAPSVEPEAERGEAQRRLFDAFLELVSRLGEERPVLLWIEDIHWADSSTRSFLRFLAASLSEERAVVVATYRPDELHRRHPLRPVLAELERASRARRIELERFDRGELSDQLADILGEQPEDAVVGRLHERTGGNPLFTEELLAAGVDGRGSLPPSLREALLVRVERLSPLSQRTLRLLAVAGRADQELLAGAGSADPGELSPALREAVEAQIVVALDVGPIRLSPRAAARGPLRRPAAGRARRAAPRARGRARAHRAERRLGLVGDRRRAPLLRGRRPAAGAEVGAGRRRRGSRHARLRRGGRAARPCDRALAAGRGPRGADRDRRGRAARRARRASTTWPARTASARLSTSARSATLGRRRRPRAARRRC